MDSKIRRLDFSPDEYMSGVAGLLRADEQGVYWMMCSIMMSEGGAIENNPRRLAGLCLIRPKRAAEIVDKLIKMGKIERENDGKLYQKRVRKEIEKSFKRIQSAHENGSKGGRPSEKDKENQQEDEAGGLNPENLTTNYQPSTSNKHVPSEQDISARDPAFPSAQDVQSAIDAYCHVASRTGLAIPKAMTPKRKAAVKARLKEGGVDGWREAMDHLAEATFLHGENERGWKANLDFVLQEGSFTKLRERHYLRSSRQHNGRPKTGLDQAEEILNERRARRSGGTDDGGFGVDVSGFPVSDQYSAPNDQGISGRLIGTSRRGD
jgi:uncharacterized protein YdaU (DUF1376 family)